MNQFAHLFAARLQPQDGTLAGRAAFDLPLYQEEHEPLPISLLRIAARSIDVRLNQERPCCEITLHGTEVIIVEIQKP